MMRVGVDAVAANDWVNEWVQKGRKKFEAVSTEDSASAARTATSLSTYPKTPEALKLIDAAFETKGLFGHMTPEQRSQVYELMTPRTISPGTELMKQGDNGDTYFVIEAGTADVYVHGPGESPPGNVVAQRGPGESVGELALMYGSPRNASIVAKTEMKLYELHRDAFRHVMVDTAQSGSEKLISFLRKVELLAGMNERDLSRLSEALEPVSYTDGQVIIREGDEVADYFYIIERGTVVVSSEGEEVVRRHEGEYFGELALLKNVARIATVTAVGDDVVLLQLSRQKFQTLFGSIGSGTDWAARYEREAQEQEEATQQAAPASSEFSGTVTRDDFVIMQTLGFGAYGRVQLVKSKANGKVYAMKILMKRHILDKKQVQHTKDEKRVIEKLNHPFVVNMVAAFQDDFNLYLVLEFVNGGELYSLLQNEGKLSEPWARMYIGELALAFYYFSQLNIIYRDLKPENLLIDARGHMKITDFGLAKEVTSRTYTMCGTPDYLAPEIIKNSGHGRGVDYWALGVVCFEMLTGLPPFYQADGRSEQTLQRILKEKPKFPASFPREARNFVMALLERDVAKRLGCLENGVQDIMTHPWFATTDWQGMAERRVPTHWQPPSSGADDTQNFDDYEPFDPRQCMMKISAAENKQFADFC